MRVRGDRAGDACYIGHAPDDPDHLRQVLAVAHTKLEGQEGRVAVLLVEQQAREALSVADRWYLLRGGALVQQGGARSGIGMLEAAYLSSMTGSAEAPISARS